jgi:dienelactone hydrolase
LVDYEDGGLACRGLVVRDTTQASPQPGVVMFPDARGIGDTAKAYARRLAGHGYVVFIVDLYGQGLFAADLQPLVLRCFRRLHCPLRFSESGAIVRVRQ